VISLWFLRTVVNFLNCFNCNLQQIDLDNAFIKSCVLFYVEQILSLRNFHSLSPFPKFKEWLDQELVLTPQAYTWLFIWSLLALYEFGQLINSIQEWRKRLFAYIFDLKNILEISTLTLSFVIIMLLLNDPKEWSVEILSYMTPITLVLNYITFILCLEKANIRKFGMNFGLYIVAYRKSFKKSLLLFPLIIFLFAGFILAFKVKTINPNEQFYDSNTWESIAKMQNMFLSSIDSNITTLGMNTNNIKTNFILFYLFVFLIAILLFNLFIGVSTGQLEEVLQTAEVIQYKLLITHTLVIQNFCIFKIGNLFSSFPSLRKTFEQGFLHRIHIKHKLTSNNESGPDITIVLMKQMNQIKSRIDQLPLKENQQQIRIEMLTKMSELYEKFEALNETTLERMNQNEIKTQRRINEMEKKLTHRIDSHANDLMNKTN